MKKVLALACAASTIALVSSAYATDSGYSVNLVGTVPDVCKIVSLTSGTTSIASGSTVTLANFADVNGVVKQQNVAGTLTLAANRKCGVTVHSDNGALKYGSTTVAYDITYGSTKHAAAVGNFITDSVDVVNAAYSVDFNLGISQGTAIVHAGDYRDTVTISINPAN